MSNKKISISILVIIIVLAVLSFWYYLYTLSISPVQPANNAGVNAQSETQDQNNGDIQSYARPGEFAISYPRKYNAQTDKDISGAFLDTPILKISFPEGSFKDEKTNFSEGYMVVAKSIAPKVVASCTSFSDMGYETAPTTTPVQINGNAFTVVAVADAGAGNLYTSRVYRTVHNNTCYEISLTVHTGNVYNYDPPVQEFDKEKVFAPLEQILNTFTWQ